MLKDKYVTRNKRDATHEYTEEELKKQKHDEKVYEIWKKHAKDGFECKNNKKVITDWKTN